MLANAILLRMLGRPAVVTPASVISPLDLALLGLIAATLVATGLRYWMRGPGLMTHTTARATYRTAELAYLRHGATGAITAALISLAHRGHIAAHDDHVVLIDPRPVTVRESRGSDPSLRRYALPPIELAVVGVLRHANSTATVAAILREVRPFAKRYLAPRLVDLGLVLSEAQVGRRHTLAMIASAIAFGAHLGTLGYAILAVRAIDVATVSLLSVLLAVNGILFAIRPSTPLTYRGLAILTRFQRARRQLEHLSPDALRRQTPEDVALRVALYGIEGFDGVVARMAALIGPEITRTNVRARHDAQPASAPCSTNRTGGQAPGPREPAAPPNSPGIGRALASTTTPRQARAVIE